MTPSGFRRIALGLAGAVEKGHHGHPDFRVENRIFATLGYPDATCGMVVLTPDQQRTWVSQHPGTFVPVKGAWGEQGCTTVRLDAIDEETLGEALTLARQNAVAKGPARASSRKPRAARKALLLVAALGLSVWAQVPLGRIIGQVTDASDGVLAIPPNPFPLQCQKNSSSSLPWRTHTG